MVRRVLAVLLLASLTLALSVGSSVGSSAAPGPPPRPVGAWRHWGLRRDREYVDPLALLGSGRVRLWPVSAAAPAAAARAARTPPAGCTPGRIRAAAADPAMGSPRPRYAARRRSGRGV